MPHPTVSSFTNQESPPDTAATGAGSVPFTARWRTTQSARLVSIHRRHPKTHRSEIANQPASDSHTRASRDDDHAEDADAQQSTDHVDVRRPMSVELQFGSVGTATSGNVPNLHPK